MNDSNSEGFSFTRDYHVDNLASASNGNKFNRDFLSFLVKSLILFQSIRVSPKRTIDAKHLLQSAEVVGANNNEEKRINYM